MFAQLLQRRRFSLDVEAFHFKEASLREDEINGSVGGGVRALVFTGQRSHNYRDNGRSLKRPSADTLPAAQSASALPHVPH